MFAHDFLNQFFETYRFHLVAAGIVLALAVVLRELPSWVAHIERFFRLRGKSPGDPSLHKKRTLEWAFALRHVIQALGGLACLAGLAGLGWVTKTVWQAPDVFHLLAMGLWVTTLAFLGFSLSSGLTPWFSPLFRRVAWRVAKALGNPSVRYRDIFLVSLLAIVAMSLIAELFRFESLKSLSHAFLLPVVACCVILVLLYGAFRVHRRIVIQPFVESKQDNDLEGIGTGLAVRLQHELARMRSLYENMDEVLPERQGEFTPLSMSVEDVGAVFKEAIGPDATLSVGAVRVPIGAILSAFGMLLRGPRITGSVQRDGSGFTLFAEISGGEWSESWQVDMSNLKSIQATLDKDGREEEELEEEDKAKTGLKAKERALLNRLVRLLACRIFTSLVPSGSPRWQAIYHFTEGLRAYRETQRTERMKVFQLRRAEKEFLQALSEDTSFARCHCNLGVVYRELGLESAEEASLRRALAEAPDAVDAFFGMATLRALGGRPLNALRHCENALRIQADNPEVWNLLALAQVKSASVDGDAQPEDGDPVWKRSLVKCSIATALAWRNLFRVTWSGRPALVQKNRKIASLCLTNLAIASAQAQRSSRACGLLRQAFSLGEDTSWLAFQLGRILYNMEKWQDSEAAFSRIYDEALDDEGRAVLSFYLLGVRCILKRPVYEMEAEYQRKVEEAYAYSLDQLTSRPWEETSLNELLDSVFKPLRSFPDGNRFDARLKSMVEALALIPQATGDRSTKDLMRELVALNATLARIQAEATGDNERASRQREPKAASAKLAVFGFRHALGIPMLESGDLDDKALREWFKNRAEDINWLRARVLFRLADCLQVEGRPTSRRTLNRVRLIEEARGLLKEEQHGLQYRREGIFRQLAEAYLEAADLPEVLRPRDEAGQRMRRESLLRNALTFAEKAVAWNPQGAPELLVLGQVYAALTDWPQAMEQWEKMLSLEPTPETWSAIASACFPKEATRPSYKPKSSEDRHRLHRFLSEALTLVESEPLSEGSDRYQIEAHAGLHFCLGQSFLLNSDYDSAIFHLTVAHDLDFRQEDAELAVKKAELAKSPIAV